MEAIVSTSDAEVQIDTVTLSPPVGHSTLCEEGQVVSFLQGSTEPVAAVPGEMSPLVDLGAHSLSSFLTGARPDDNVAVSGAFFGDAFSTSLPSSLPVAPQLEVSCVPTTAEVVPAVVTLTDALPTVMDQVGSSRPSPDLFVADPPPDPESAPVAPPDELQSSPHVDVVSSPGNYINMCYSSVIS